MLTTNIWLNVHLDRTLLVAINKLLVKFRTDIWPVLGSFEAQIWLWRAVYNFSMQLRLELWSHCRSLMLNDLCLGSLFCWNLQLCPSSNYSYWFEVKLRKNKVVILLSRPLCAIRIRETLLIPEGNWVVIAANIQQASSTHTKWVWKQSYDT